MPKPRWNKGVPTLDSPHRMSMLIRGRDIEGAEPLDGSRCVAARCIARAFDAERVYVYRSKTYVQYEEGGPVYRFQNSARLIKDVIDILDNPHMPNSAIKPGLYELLPPTPAQALGRDRTPKNPGTRRPRKDRGHKVIGRIAASVAVPELV